MSKASIRDRQILLFADATENAATAAHYAQMVGQYRDLNNRGGARYSLKCALACFKAAIASFKELEALDEPNVRPIAEMSEAAE